MWFSLLFLLLFFFGPNRYVSVVAAAVSRSRDGPNGTLGTKRASGGEDEEERGSQCLIAVLDSTEKALAENCFLGISVYTTVKDCWLDQPQCVRDVLLPVFRHFCVPPSLFPFFLTFGNCGD